LVPQPEAKPELRITGQNPAHLGFGFCLDNQIKSNCHETLGLETPLGDEHNQGSKAGR